MADHHHFSTIEQFAPAQFCMSHLVGVEPSVALPEGVIPSVSGEFSFALHPLQDDYNYCAVAIFKGIGRHGPTVSQLAMATVANLIETHELILKQTKRALKEIFTATNQTLEDEIPHMVARAT